MAKGFDTDRSFALVEISGNQLSYQVISRAGETVDSGEIAAKVSPGPKSPPSN